MISLNQKISLILKRTVCTIFAAPNRGFLVIFLTLNCTQNQEISVNLTRVDNIIALSLSLIYQSRTLIANRDFLAISLILNCTENQPISVNLTGLEQ